VKTAPISASVVEDFVTCYHAEDRSKPGEAERFRAFGYDELVARDKANLEIFWLKDKSLEGADNLQPPTLSRPRSRRTLRPPWSRSLGSMKA
jgi:type I restriction enzyme M protein